MVIEGINYEWVQPIIINYVLIASTLSSCYHCGYECVHVCLCVNPFGSGGWWVVVLIGPSAAGGPSGESFTVKSLWAAERTLVLLSSDGCLNGAGM